MGRHIVFLFSYSRGTGPCLLLRTGPSFGASFLEEFGRLHEVNLIIMNEELEVVSDVRHLAEAFEDGNEHEEFSAAHVVVPTLGRKGALRMEKITRRRIINNDSVLQWPVYPVKVFHIDSIEISAMFSYKSV